MANLSQIQKEVSQVYEEILKLRNEQKSFLEQVVNKPTNESNDLNAIAAKIINDISKIIESCPCNKEILEALGKQPDKQLVTQPEIKTAPTVSSGKYSYPNFGVGNEELGSSGNPNAMKWPFETPKGWPNNS
ncbi:putative DNA-binding protein [Isatis caulimovirus A]|nr:putative DNA-binding protein [Isatis caulimovirus A]